MFIEQLKRQPLLQIIWTGLIIAILSLLFYLTPTKGFYKLSPFIADSFPLADQLWKRILISAASFILLFVSLFKLSSVLRNYHFTADSRFDMLFLLLPFLLIFPELLFHINLAIFIFFLQKALQLQFEVHTQIRINREIALLALYMSFSSMFFPKALLIAVILYLGVLIQRGFYLKEFLIYFLLLGLPYYFIASILYLLELPFTFYIDLEPNLYQLGGFDIATITLLGFSGLFLIFLFKSITLSSKAVLRSKAQFRNFYNLLIVGLAVFIIFKPVEGIAIMFLPIFSIFASTLPEMKKSWIYESSLILLALISLLGFFS